MDVQIRSATSDDALALAALRLQQDRDRGHAPRPGFLDEYAAAFVAEIADYHVWLAEQDDGRPVGCVLALRVRKLPTLVWDGRAEWWYVQQVFVTPDRRREGIARALLETVQQEARGQDVRHVLLSSSAAGRPLFEALGFHEPSPRLMEWVPPGSGGLFGA
ncbi:GNAT family N-acetyltransferase [Janibacter sp. G56]|uniref:GNAT family N-acetyltransferase n=1 Tax=Janibacter sp. G56 TaxID=3418717 RepID=UPI003D01C982